MSCIICSENAKYKCPTCRQSYCSVACCKLHKETPCQAPPPSDTETNVSDIEREYHYPTEDTVSVDRLKLLESSNDIKKMLQDRFLREILQDLDQAPNPDEIFQNYMQDTLFTQFVDECLKVVQP